MAIGKPLLVTEKQGVQSPVLSAQITPLSPRVAAQQLSFADYGVGMANAKASVAVAGELLAMVGDIGTAAIYVDKTKKEHARLDMMKGWQEADSSYAEQFAAAVTYQEKAEVTSRYQESIGTRAREYQSVGGSSLEAQKSLVGLTSASRSVLSQMNISSAAKLVSETESGYKLEQSRIGTTIATDPTSDMVVQFQKYRDVLDQMVASGMKTKPQAEFDQLVWQRKMHGLRGTLIGGNIANEHINGGVPMPSNENLIKAYQERTGLELDDVQKKIYVDSANKAYLEKVRAFNSNEEQQRKLIANEFFQLKKNQLSDLEQIILGGDATSAVLEKMVEDGKGLNDPAHDEAMAKLIRGHKYGVANETTVLNFTNPDALTRYSQSDAFMTNGFYNIPAIRENIPSGENIKTVGRILKFYEAKNDEATKDVAATIENMATSATIAVLGKQYADPEFLDAFKEAFPELGGRTSVASLTSELNYRKLLGGDPEFAPIYNGIIAEFKAMANDEKGIFREDWLKKHNSVERQKALGKQLQERFQEEISKAILEAQIKKGLEKQEKLNKLAGEEYTTKVGNIPPEEPEIKPTLDEEGGWLGIPTKWFTPFKKSLNEKLSRDPDAQEWAGGVIESVDEAVYGFIDPKAKILGELFDEYIGEPIDNFIDSYRYSLFGIEPEASEAHKKAEIMSTLLISTQSGNIAEEMMAGIGLNPSPSEEAVVAQLPEDPVGKGQWNLSDIPAAVAEFQRDIFGSETPPTSTGLESKPIAVKPEKAYRESQASTQQELFAPNVESIAERTAKIGPSIEPYEAPSVETPEEITTTDQVAVPEAPPKDYSTSKIKSVATNNPLNLRATNTPWQGKGEAENGFETFITARDGLIAGVLNAVNKLKPGRYTPKELIEKRNIIIQDGGEIITGNTLSLGEVINILSPRSDDNPTDLMIKEAARDMGIKPTDTVDISNEGQIRKLVDSLLLREASRFKYPDDLLNSTISSAIGKALGRPKGEQPVPPPKVIESIVKESIVKKKDNLFKTLGKLSRKALTEAVPDNLRFFASYLKDNNMLASLGFGRKKPVVTEEALSEGVQSVLKQAVKKAISEGRNYVDYSDYPDTSFGMSIPAIVATAGRKSSEYADAKKRYPSGWKGMAQLLMDSFDDSVAAATTIGGFQFKIENGNVIITDIYDFSRFKSKQNSAYAQVRSSVETAKGEVAYNIKANLGKLV